jgi:hypothetical protein
MTLSLLCRCGVRFEVEDALAGQSIACPECQQTLAAPTGDRPAVRTSGWALASFVCALVLAFTGVGSLLAVLLGLVALIDVARNRGRVTGRGYALFGVIVGLLSTGVFAFAVSRQELIGGMIRERFQAGQVDRTGPLEVADSAKTFHITRPSSSWGVAKDKTAADWNPDAELVLTRLGPTAYVDVVQADRLGKSLVALRDEEIREYRTNFGFHHNVIGSRTVVESEKRQLTDAEGREIAEVRLEVRNKGQTTIYWIRVVGAGDRAYILRGGGSPSAFAATREEIRQAFDSFRFE